MDDLDFQFNDNLKDSSLGCGCIIAGAMVPIFAILLLSSFASTESDVEGFATLIVSLCIIVALIAYIVNSQRKRTLTYVTQPHWKPDTDVVAMTYGYDHRIKSYKVCVSPIIYLPSERSLMDAWLAEKEKIEAEYLDGEAVMQAARSLYTKLTDEGWKVKLVPWAEFQKRLPCWEYDSDKDIKEIELPNVAALSKFNPDRLVDWGWCSDFTEDDIVPSPTWRYSRHIGARWCSDFTEDDIVPPLRDDLQAKIDEENFQREKLKRENQEYDDVMRPLPDWVREKDNEPPQK